MWIAWGLLAAAMLACGRKEPSPATVTDQPPAEPPTVVPAGGLPTAASGPVTPVTPTVATYEDAEAVYRTGRFTEAKAAFETYVGLKPQNPWGHYMLGLAAWKSGDFKTAEQAFDRAITLDSTVVKSYLGSARVLLDLKREPEAIERINRAIGLDSTSTEALRLLARAVSQQGAVDSAIEIYRTVLTRNDRDVWAMNNLGVLYLDQGQPESAIGPLARAVELNGTAPVFHNNLGMALERTGHFGAAKDAYDAAVKADPTYRKAVANRDRIAAMDLVATDSVAGFIKDQADAFRLLIGMWRDR
jgi:tetratricopeptide (TPR) repeat protein